ncbi:MAG: DUF445 domain-containing protein [Bdellovibrionota bacterium]
MDTELRSSLRRMKAVATGLLAIAAMLFAGSVVYEPVYPQLVWLRVFSEAALIGGLADWFAVTALFRHPLGLPIPHTAIIPKGKERIGQNLGQFIQTNFLTTETVGRKLSSYDFGHKVARWLQEPETAERLSNRAAAIIPSALEALDDREVQLLLDRNIRGLLQATEAAPLVGRALAFLLSGAKFDIVLAGALDVFDVLFEENEDVVKDVLRNEIPWYVPGFMHDRVFQRISGNIRDLIFDLRSDPHHPLRSHIREKVEQFVAELQSSKDYLERGERLKASLLASELPPEYVAQLWNEIKRSISTDLSVERSLMKQNIAKATRAFGATLASDEALQQKVNRALVSIAASAISTYSDNVRSFVAETVDRWDEATITEKVELHIGRDLQYIRLNGTLVGGLVGLLIYYLSTLRGF